MIQMDIENRTEKSNSSEKKEVTLRVALQMLEHGIPRSFIRNVTGLSSNEIEELEKK
jgi:hypothetical protein